MQVDPIRILSVDELLTVLDDLDRRAKRAQNSAVNRVIFRLSACCGLRRMEIAGLELRDFQVEGERPYIHIRRDNTKGKEEKRRARKVPLWWDQGTRECLHQWLTARTCQGATGSDPYVCSIGKRRSGSRLSPVAVSRRWETAIRILGSRASDLTIHCGRHTFISHALAGGHSLPAVRDAAGHANIATTSIYLHAIEEDVPDLFPRGEANGA